jgi:hypothetical protein
MNSMLAARLQVETKTKTALARATAAAAEHASTQPPLEVHNPAQLRDLAASAARVFGWDKGPQTAVQVNELRITQEQLEQMRVLCDNPFKKPAISEEDTGV